MSKKSKTKKLFREWEKINDRMSEHEQSEHERSQRASKRLKRSIERLEARNEYLASDKISTFKHARQSLIADELRELADRIDEGCGVQDRETLNQADILVENLAELFNWPTWINEEAANESEHESQVA